MTLRPILFRPQMVTAIRSGVKVETRRPVKDPARPPCAVGDLLWVRETWREEDGRIVHQADCPPGRRRHFSWRPSIFMPKRACRLILSVEEVTSQRLIQIRAAGVLAEGVGLRAEFRELWDSIHDNKPTAWANNPTVWVIRFRALFGSERARALAELKGE